MTHRCEVPNLPVVRVSAAVFRSRHSVLGFRRAPEQQAAGYWEFPGGKIEKDETPAQALEREIREELGVEIEAKTELLTSATPFGKALVEISFFEAFLPSKTTDGLRSSDHDQIRWIDLSEIRRFRWAPPDWPMVEALLGDKGLVFGKKDCDP